MSSDAVKQFLNNQTRPDNTNGAKPALAVDASELPLLKAALSAAPVPGGAPRTLVMLVLDESGSMQHGFEETVAGVNKQIGVLGENDAAAPVEVSLLKFNSDAHLVFGPERARNAPKLSNDNYRPGGNTALFDAVAAGVKTLLLHPDAAKEETALLLAVFTDGQENSSRRWNATQVSELMRCVAENARITVTLMGPAGHLQEMSDVLHVPAGNVAAFEPARIASRVMARDSMSQGLRTYMYKRVAGEMSSRDYYSRTESGALAQTELGDKARRPPKAS